MNKTCILLLVCAIFLLMIGVANATVVDSVSITSGNKLSTVDEVMVSAHCEVDWSFGLWDSATGEGTSGNHMNFFWEMKVYKKSMFDSKIGSKKIHVEYYITDSRDGYLFRLHEEGKDWSEWELTPLNANELKTINNIPFDIDLGTGNYDIYAKVRIVSEDTFQDVHTNWKTSATLSIQITLPPHLSHWPSEPVSGSSSTVKVNQIVEIPFVAYNDGGLGGESYVTVLTDSPYLEITERRGYPGSCTKIYKPSDPVHYKDGRYQPFDGWLADANRALKQNSYIGFSKVKFKPTRAGTYHIYWRAAFDTPANGCYFIRFPSSGAVDPLGYTTRYITIEVTDNVKPSIAITYPTNEQEFETSIITVTGTASDNSAVSKVEVKVGSSGSWHTASGTNSWKKSVTLSSGSNTIYARATDTPGNTKEASVTVTYNPPPTITITEPTNWQTFTTDTITVSGTAWDNDDVSKVEVKVGSGNWQEAQKKESWSMSVTLAPGENTIYAKATDTSGKSKEASVTVTYTTADPQPTITITEPTNGQTFTTDTITVSGTAWDNDAVSKVEVKVGSGSWLEAQGEESWSMSVTLAPGENTIYARATDTSGKTKEASVTVIHTTADPPPTITITEPTSGQTFTTDTITVRGTAWDNDDVSKVEVKVGFGFEGWLEAQGEESWSMSVTLSPGENRICARATDTSSKTKVAAIRVIYTPGQEPKLCTSHDPPSHDFGVVPKGQEKSWNFDITNCGSDTLTWSVSCDQPWIKVVYPTSDGTTEESDRVTVTVDTHGLSEGKTYTGHITVTSNGGEKRGTITVNIEQTGPKLCTSPDPPSHDFGMAPKDQEKSWDFEITNCGSDTLEWVVSEVPHWITVGTTSGETTTETDVVTITIDTSGLPPGTYWEDLIVNSNGGSKRGAILVIIPDPNGPPILCTSPDSLAHDFGTVPIGQERSWEFEITNCGSDTLLWEVSSFDPSWISTDVLQESTTTETDTVTVTINTNKLSYGKHGNYFRIISNGGEKMGKITVDVSPPESEPKLCTSPDSLSHDFGMVPKDQEKSWNFEITNCGSDTLTWSVSCDQPWIKVVYPTSDPTTKETDVVTVTIDTHDLTPGLHTGQITITSNGGEKTGTITVDVSPPESEPKLCTSPNPSPNFDTVPKGQTRSWDFFITNCGSGTLTWAITCDQPSWLNVNPASDSTMAIDVVTVTIDTHDLSPGTHTGQITIDSNGGSKMGTVTVEVVPPTESEPKLCTAPDPPTINFGTVPKDQTRAWDFFIMNSGSDTLTWSITCDQPSWLNVNQVSDSTAKEVSVVTVTMDTHDLTPGTHTGHITIDSNGGRKIGTITVTVPPPALEPKLCTAPDPPTTNFGTVAKDQTRTWDFFITNCGSGTLTWTITCDQPSWLNVNPAIGSTTTLDVVTVTIDTHDLSPGTHTGHITLTSNGGEKTGTITVNVPEQIRPNLCTSPDPPSHDFGTVAKDQTRTWDFDITNCGSGTLTWSVSDDKNWISVYPTSGSTTTERDTVTVTISTSGLTPGTHTGHITLTSNGGSKTGTITVVVPKPQNQPPENPTLTPDRSSPQLAGTTIKWTASATDPDGDTLYYQFRLKGPATGNSWQIKRDWSTARTWTWYTTASDVGESDISVRIRDGHHAQASSYDLKKTVYDYKITADKKRPTATIDSITPNPATQGDDTVRFKGHGYDSDGYIVDYYWKSSKDGKLSSSKEFTKSASNLDVGTHTIYFKVKDDDGQWSDWATVTLKIEKKEDLKYVKFRGVVTWKSSMRIGGVSWVVNVDEWISGSISCDEIEVIWGSGVSSGSFDPDISTGDRVEAYGKVNPWENDECSVGLNDESHYIKKTEQTPQENCKVQITSHSSLQDRPSIVYANGYYYVAYQSHEKGYGIFLEKFDSNWKLNKKVEVVSGSAYYDSPSLLFANNKLYVAYISNAKGANKNDYDVIVKEYSPSSLSCTKGAKYLTSLQSCQDLPALYYKAGYYYMAYQSWETGNGDIYIKKFDSSWNQLKKVRVASGSSLQDRPSITYADRCFYVAYFSKETGNYDIFVQNLNNDLIPLWGRRQITSESSSQSYPFITFVNNQFAISYASTESGTLGIYMKKYSSSWKFIEKTKVVDSSANERRPSHTWDGSNFWVAYVYNYGDSKDWNIFAINPGCEGGSVPTPTPLP